MELEQVVKALGSALSRSVLEVLSEEPETVRGVRAKLSQKGHYTEHRETVYRALERLVKAGIVVKSYCPGKGLCYGLATRRVMIDLMTGDVRRAFSRK